MLTPDQIQDAVLRLHNAEQTRVQIRQLSLQYPEITIEDAYAVQAAWVAHKVSKGRSIYGHKIGLTSRAMQMSSNISEPDYGVLLDDMVFSQGSELPISRFTQPKVEVELAFLLERDLSGPNCSVFDVLKATTYVVPAIEIIDARIERTDKETGVTRKVYDTISDNAANAGIVLGGRPVRPDAADLRWVGALLYRNGVIEETGVAAGVLNHPANGVAWLANKLHPHGVTLRAGQTILAGSFTRPVDAAAGDTFHADYGELGGIGFRFSL
ncbi:2-oxo-hepta-3-ene-1,7-dioic acid hydratase [Deinococcus detaillensis]|uniref:2-oxo-hepta-3-ene-1,7-dioic acid hydratase n=1 Tax=Deinococcus detaillensis TaxID=2592048 RepID=A0A553V5S5_9DEIO|nr:2-oxo-hepta-3-ene-1,7-dioic acid hydratase [Deinococcus detaillensis]TSA87581.1 2-oxo-hepta-3-ene-1,7-dioic acid hydratase [Deinococcus detaillensis]